MALHPPAAFAAALGLAPWRRFPTEASTMMCFSARPPRKAVYLLVVSLLSSWLVSGCASRGTTAAAGSDALTSTAEQLDFGVKMARRGLWSEALFRFRQAEQLSPGNPRITNNIAVAYEALGQFDAALEHYQTALRADPANAELKRNYSRFVEFYRNFRPEGEATPEEAP